MARENSEAVRPYWHKRAELTIEGNCILWGVRVLIPTPLRERVVRELHRGHPGIVRMKSLARSHVWWPAIDKDLENCAKSCRDCQAIKNAPPKAPLHPWEWPTAPWKRIHVDFAGPVDGKMLLITTDAHSKWPEVCVMNSTTAARTIAALRNMFARYGIPEQMVSDNGPQFVAEEMRQFLATNGVKHLRSAPYYPATNGAAERLVQTVKRALKAGHERGVPLEKTLATFLLQYRTTPHATTGVSPASLFMRRDLHTRLDLLKPDVGAQVRRQQGCQKMYHDLHSRTREFAVGQTVWTRNMREGPRWVPGSVVEKLGPVSFLVHVSSGELWRRHVDHIREGGVSPPGTQGSHRQDAPGTKDSQSQEDDTFLLVPFPTTPVVSSEPEVSVATSTDSESASQNSRPSTEPRYPSRVRRRPERFM